LLTLVYLLLQSLLEVNRKSQLLTVTSTTGPTGLNYTVNVRPELHELQGAGQKWEWENQGEEEEEEEEKEKHSWMA